MVSYFWGGSKKYECEMKSETETTNYFSFKYPLQIMDAPFHSFSSNFKI